MKSSAAVLLTLILLCWAPQHARTSDLACETLFQLNLEMIADDFEYGGLTLEEVAPLILVAQKSYFDCEANSLQRGEP